MSTDHTEIEWQFDATDLEAVRQWLTEHADKRKITIQPDKTRQQVDTYCDTADWRIYHAGYALRVRRIGEQAEATLKSLALAGKGQARHRREISEDLPAGTPADDALGLLHQAHGDVGRRVHALAGKHAVRRLFELHTERCVYQLSIAGISAGEIALDETRIIARPRGKEAHLRRVEVEVLDDSTAGLAAFVTEMCQACELRPAMVTKFEAGLLAQRLTPTPPTHFGSTTVNDASTIGDLALAVFRNYFSVFLEHEPGVRLDEDVEELHAMRLASAHVRAALRLFGRVLPAPYNDMTADVKWISALLGAVRDLDVQTQWVSTNGSTHESTNNRSTSEPAHNGSANKPMLEPEMGHADAEAEALVELNVVMGLLAEKRRVARQAMMQALDSPRYERFKARMSTLLSHPPTWPRRANHPASAVVRDKIRSSHRKARRSGDALSPASTPADYHALRIKLKHLRYSLEFVNEIYGKPSKRMLKRVTTLADMLGNYHDLQVIGEQLHAWQADSSLAQGT
ncbi:MAG TPA: CHAD domain-containing protein, partial [Anaerolineae bacterium]